MKTVLLSMLLMAMALPVQAQSEVLVFTKIVQGTVKEIKANTLGILRDSNKILVRVMIDSNTEYNNAQRLDDLKAGDKVQVEYQIANGRNTAVTVTKLEGGEI